MAEIYKKFAEDKEGVDFSDTAMEEMYQYESIGKEFNNPMNGYFLGKKWMDVTIEMWRHDIKEGLLFRFELEEEFPKWWLDKILAGISD